MPDMHPARGRIQQRLLKCFGLLDDCWLSDTEHLTDGEREYLDDLIKRVETMIAKFEFDKPKGEAQSNENKADTAGGL